jgi:Flp pilus assembly protein TadD
VLKIDNKYVNAWSGKGIALDHLGRHDEAKKCFEIAKQLA